MVGTKERAVQILGNGEMSTVVIPMHRTTGGVVELSHVLNALPENAWAWSMLELWGVGIAPNGMAMPSFEDSIAASDSGYQLSWRELVGFASGLNQVHDCLIVAANSPQDLSRQLIEKDSCSKLLVAIEALDSTRWEIVISENLGEAEEIKTRLALLK
ncbi:hypothetical protein [Nonomuraea roseoviolacea]|uniref:Uncharacterized protein n=1 Tax=Nonomuraea roseoviolacea subsp. carminata TaxID=160689 RepID=A0ABT1K0W2_9ACTN|nr:hypothetical protein [Nonomuraea roseoviolacea]MCP2347307.1 hypothetical protein [Nonomuraea roseoviolacea subsp. carminata]